jgi:hypothetical protein
MVYQHKTNVGDAHSRQRGSYGGFTPEKGHRSESTFIRIENIRIVVKEVK